MINVRTYLRKYAQETSGVVWVSFYINREKVNFSTKVSVDCKNWNEKNACVKPGDKNAADKNLIIENIHSRINNVLVKYRLKDKKLTRDAFLRAYHRPNDYSCFFDYVTAQQKRLSVRTETSTLNTHMSAIRKIQQFAPTLTFDDITKDWLDDYFIYLRKELDNNSNTAYKNMGILKKYVRMAYKDGYMDENPFEAWQIKKTTASCVYLTEDELTRLTALYRSGELEYNLHKTLEFFLFLCFSSLHVGKARIRVPRWTAALLTLILIWLILIGLFWLFVPIVFQTIKQFSSLDITHVVQSFQEPLSVLERFIEKAFSLHDGDFSLMEAISRQITPLFDLNLINNLLSSIVSTVSGAVVAAFSISFITFFFLKESNLFSNMVIIMFPKKYEGNITRALDSITNLLIRYFTGIVTESSIMIVIVSLGLLLLGFAWQTALIIGLIVGVLNVIPYLGPIIGMAIGILIGVVGGGIYEVTTLGVVVRIAGTILFAQGVDNFVLQPVLYSNRAKAHPLEIFLVILIAGSLAGVLGMLLAIPAYNVIRVFAKEFFNNFRVVQKLTEKI